MKIEITGKSWELEELFPIRDIISQNLFEKSFDIAELFGNAEVKGRLIEVQENPEGFDIYPHLKLVFNASNKSERELKDKMEAIRRKDKEIGEAKEAVRKKQQEFKEAQRKLSELMGN